MRMEHRLLKRTLTAAAVLAAALCCTTARADETKETLPPGAHLVKIEAQPARIVLANPFQYAQVVLTGVLDTGERIDVTRMAELNKPANVKVSPAVLVRPTADGDGVLKFSLAGQTAAIPVKVTGQKDKYEVSFIRDVMPTMSRVGCNAGTCHGSAKGKNGFKLSLRGYDPVLDHRSLTDDLEGRRFNRAAPDTSLMLLKPSGEVPHVGGALMHPGEPDYELLRLWIAQGVKLDVNSPRVAKIEVFPKGCVIPLPQMKQQMAVYATYTDGTVRDVTAEAFLDSSNNEVALVNRQGTAAAIRRGESTVLARYEGAYAASGVVVMGDRSGYGWKDVEAYNDIDNLVYDKLRLVKELPSGVCTDAEFIRRVYLDLTGLPPQPDQVRAFLADARPQRVKRDELVDKLIGSPEYVDYWTNKWSDLLDVNPKFLGVQGAKAYHDWIHKAVADNMPYDQFAHAILTGSGSNLDDPPASYFKILREPDAAMENTTQLFLAVRFNCNKCHDHPFERLDADPVLRLGCVLRPGRSEGGPALQGPKGRRHRRRGRQAAGRDHRRRQGRRGEERANRRRGPADVPVRRQRPGPARRHAARAAGPLDHVEGEPVFRQELCQSSVELPAGRRRHRAGGRHPGRQSAEQPAAARPADAGVHRRRLQLAGDDPRHLQIADVSALDSDQPVEQGRRRQLRPRRAAASAGRGDVRHDRAGHRIPPAACRTESGRRSCSTPPRAIRAASSICSASRRARAFASASAPAA